MSKSTDAYLFYGIPITKAPWDEKDYKYPEECDYDDPALLIELCQSDNPEVSDYPVKYDCCWAYDGTYGFIYTKRIEVDNANFQPINDIVTKDNIIEEYLQFISIKDLCGKTGIEFTNPQWYLTCSHG